MRGGLFAHLPLGDFAPFGVVPSFALTPAVPALVTMRLRYPHDPTRDVGVNAPVIIHRSRAMQANELNHAERVSRQL